MCNLSLCLSHFQGPLGLDGKPVSDYRETLGGPGTGPLVGLEVIGGGCQREGATGNPAQHREKSFGHQTGVQIQLHYLLTVHPWGALHLTSLRLCQMGPLTLLA